MNLSISDLEQERENPSESESESESYPVSDFRYYDKSKLVTSEEGDLLIDLGTCGGGTRPVVEQQEDANFLLRLIKSEREADPDAALEAMGQPPRPPMTLDSVVENAEGGKKKRERGVFGYRSGHGDKRNWEAAKAAGLNLKREKQAAGGGDGAAGGGPTIEAEGAVVEGREGDAAAAAAAKGAADGALEDDDDDDDDEYEDLELALMKELKLDEAALEPATFDVDPATLSPQELNDAYAAYVGRRAKSEWAALEAIKDHRMLGFLPRCVSEKHPQATSRARL
jgi:hypothetical protein